MPRRDSEDIARIKERIAEITDGLLARDHARVIAPYALDDPRFTAFEDRAPFRRLDGGQLKELFREVEEIDEMKNRKHGIRVDLLGDVAVATGYEDWSTVKGKKETKASSRFTMVFVRKGSDWVVMHEQFTRTA